MIARTAGIVFAFLLAACRDAPARPPTVAAADLAAPSADEPSPAPASTVRQPGGCSTLVDAEPSDVLRGSRFKRGLLYYANAQVGLAIVDVSDPDRPTVAATSRFTGVVAGVFEAGDAVVVVFEPWDRPAETVIRAIEPHGRNAGRTRAEIVLPGAPRDVWRIGDAIVVVRDDRVAGATLLDAFVLDGGVLRAGDALRLAGAGATVGASPWGIAVARPADAADRTWVTWVAVDERNGGLERRGSALVAGVVPRWRSPSDHVLDVAEDGYLRLVTCATAACAPGEAAVYSALDFAEPDRPREQAAASIPRAGDAVVAFAGRHLVVARASEATTELAIFRAGKALEAVGSFRVAGTVSSLPVHDERVFALGWSGSARTGKRALVHAIAVGDGAPRLLGSTSFGDDWTWSPAYDDDRAISFDPRSAFAALPMTTVRGDGPAHSAVQVFAFGSSGPRRSAEIPSDGDRLAFVDGRLIAFSVDGPVVLGSPGDQAARSGDGIGAPR